jgi:phosphoserine phosphatase RsbU/P
MWTSVSRAIGVLTSGEDADRQLDLAAERIQSALLKVTLPEIRGIELGVHAEPARLVGGDYLDVFSPREGCVLFGLGDASGKSLAAALNALMLRYLVRGLAQALGTEDLNAILSHTNSVVSQDLNHSDHFITLILGTIDTQSGRLRVANAGHEPPLVLRDDASEVEVVETHDLVLGVNTHEIYGTEEVVLSAGDKVVVYTDGLTEATNKHGELLTLKRLCEMFVEHRDLPAQELADTLFGGVKEFAGQHMRDDATLLVLHRLHPDSPSGSINVVGTAHRDGTT